MSEIAVGAAQHIPPACGAAQHVKKMLILRPTCPGTFIADALENRGSFQFHCDKGGGDNRKSYYSYVGGDR